MGRVFACALLVLGCKIEETPGWGGQASATGTGDQTTGVTGSSTTNPGSSTSTSTSSSTTASTDSASAGSSSTGGTGGTGVSASGTTASTGSSTSSGGGSTTGPSGAHVLFVTSTTQTADMGGFAAADALCQGLADTAGLTGTFLSVLGETQITVADRISITMPVVNTIGEEVAPDATSLWDGNITASVAYDENGDPATGTPFTGADVGGIGSANNCMVWTATNGNAAAGDVSIVGSGWLRSGSAPCGSPNPIYCIEQ